MSQLSTFVKEFPNGHQALSVRVNGQIDPALIAEALQLPTCSRLLLLSGGAGGMSHKSFMQLKELFAAISHMVAQTNCTIIDGGTQSGIMQLMGEALAQTGPTAPHIGVVPAQAEAEPGKKAEDVLEPNHSNFVLVNGTEWGDEVTTMYSLANHLAQQAPSLAVLVNGGGISLQEVEQNIEQGREIIVIKGSGRLADEIAQAIIEPTRPVRDKIERAVRRGRFTIFDIEAPPLKILDILLQRLY